MPVSTWVCALSFGRCSCCCCSLRLPRLNILFVVGMHPLAWIGNKRQRPLPRPLIGSPHELIMVAASGPALLAHAVGALQTPEPATLRDLQPSPPPLSLSAAADPEG